MMNEDNNFVTEDRTDLVGAPAGEVDAPLVELEAGVADGVGQVPPHAAPLRPGRTRDHLHLEELS